ncbi:hypothetical protein BC937DRAFT_91362 [Endogone sp. FLAS-F59071]|nr:hypothetical protein BC937DRAFT_91362 [Endogone sp. FLAS-F59071]|eukprot:RUS16317.1 hypothetical protein BC937DRAFT_91362 [Endogone sp. FLAS-F59071]
MNHLITIDLGGGKEVLVIFDGPAQFAFGEDHGYRFGLWCCVLQGVAEVVESGGAGDGGAAGHGTTMAV